MNLRAASLTALIALVWLTGCGDETLKNPSEAMAPTYKAGEDVSVEKDAGSVKVEDVLVVYPPTGAESDQCGVPRSPGSPCARPTPTRSDQRFVKRLVAGPGDRVSFVRGRVVLNGKPQADPHANTSQCPQSPDICNLPRPVTVPAGHYFVVGDNRGASDDSRTWGPVPKAWIYGKVTGKA